MNETEVEELPNLGKSPLPRVSLPDRWTNLGGFCVECGGTGRSETGCQPCFICDGGKI
jgi:hypothetical protein